MPLSFFPTHPISIHAPRTGSDILAEMEKAKEDISIHAPRTGSDLAFVAV